MLPPLCYTGRVKPEGQHSEQKTGGQKKMEKNWVPEDTTKPLNLPKITELLYQDSLCNEFSLMFKTHLIRFSAPCSQLHIDAMFFITKHKTLKNVQIPVSS